MQSVSNAPAAAAAAAAAVAVHGTLLAAGSAQAVIISSGPVNLAMPNTAAGLHVNVLNGSSFSGPATFPVLGGPGANCDFNIFGTAALTFFSPSGAGLSR